MKKITISTALLARLCDRLEARIPEPTTLTDPSRLEARQRVANDGIERDHALVDEARHLLRPNFQKSVDQFTGFTLEELRFARESALSMGNTVKAFAIATAIDRKRGLY